MIQPIVVEVPGFTRRIVLEEGQRLCPECGGRCIGYGRFHGGSMVMMPDADNAWLHVCDHCRDGVQRQCPLCQAWSAAPSFCGCAGRHKAHMAQRLAAEIAKFDTAQHMTIEYARAVGIEYVYFPGEDGDQIVGIGDIEEQADERRADWKDSRPLFAWATRRQDLSLDADSIVEGACQDLHEDAYDSIGSEAFAELQAFLTAWCAKHGDGCATYWPDHSRAIILPAEVEVAAAGEGGARG